MADVFLARDQLLDRPVAIKMLFPEYATIPTSSSGSGERRKPPRT